MADETHSSIDTLIVSIAGKDYEVKANARPTIEAVVEKNLVTRPKPKVDVSVHPNQTDPLHPRCAATKGKGPDPQRCNRPAGHMNEHAFGDGPLVQENKSKARPEAPASSPPIEERAVAPPPEAPPAEVPKSVLDGIA